MEEILFSLKHYWRFVDSEVLALKALSWMLDEKAACTQAERNDRSSQIHTVQHPSRVPKYRCYASTQVPTKRPDTGGQPPSTEIGVPNMPSLKAKKLSKLPQENVL